ncbi:MAG: DUF3868 domain-containing protein [Rikenellaceae bacterium]
MKKNFLLSLGVLISTVVTAQTVHVDIEGKECKFVNDSLIVQISLSGNINDLNSRDAVMLTPYLSTKDESVSIDLPYIQYNGKYKQILYVRNKEIRSRMKNSDVVSDQYTQGLNPNGKFSMDYVASVAKADWMNGAVLQIKCESINADNEMESISNIFVQNVEDAKRYNNTNRRFITSTPNSGDDSSTFIISSQGEEVATYSYEDLNYRGNYVAPDSDATDERNQRDLNFNLEETQVMFNVKPEILSLKELFNVAMSYQNDREKFYNVILKSVELYPTHPIANLNAASMSIELGNKEAANKYLQIAPYESLAYKNCRGAYELMNDNTYEGIRLLKSAEAEGSEEAGYNLSLFFQQNK